MYKRQTRDKTFFYMELSDIDDLQVVGGTTKGKSLVLGRCLFEEAKKLLRWRACHPKVDVQSHDETDRALGMIFYGVQGAEAAAELLRQGLSLIHICFLLWRRRYPHCLRKSAGPCTWPVDAHWWDLAPRPGCSP